MKWDMEAVGRLDSKGRVVIPPEMRTALGDRVTIRKTEEGVLLVPGEKPDFIAEFLRKVEEGPRRTGKPSNPDPAKMKSIWNERR